MKTYLISFLLISVLSRCWGNENDCNDIQFGVEINELLFDDGGNWKMHINCRLYVRMCSPDGEAKIDSIYLSSSSGIYKLRSTNSMKVIPNYILNDYYITSDSLTDNLYIDNVSDSVTLIAYLCELRVKN
jgi:hypothetical protein